jgi:hypothetical protein
MGQEVDRSDSPDVPPSPSTSLERYADVLAHVIFFKNEDRDEVRERLGVDAAEWRRADEVWLSRMADDLQEGDTALSERFAHAFVAAKNRLDAERPSIDDLGPRRSAELTAVDDSAESSTASDAMPATPEAREPEPQAPRPSVAEPARVASALPVAPRERTPEAPSPWSTPPAPGASAVDQTSHLEALRLDDPLPFAKDAVRPPIPAAEEAPRVGTGDTQEVPAILADKDATLPFVNAFAAELRASLRQQLTLEQYASLEAELEHAPAERAATLERFGVADERTYQLLRDAWHNHLDGAPFEMRRWNELRLHYRQWLIRSRG